MNHNEKKPVLMTPEERSLCAKYAEMTDDELMELIRKQTKELGRLPTKSDIPGAVYFKQRFGPWPRILEAAGVKPLSERKQRKAEANKRRHSKLRKRSTENRRKRREAREAAETQNYEKE
ncbi:MAG: hypothetical protein IJ443_06510 [Firmicutes bacterium]|nr:hypothetical protein [Bacillota bacterium]